jgi:DNA-binding transcriptional regulator YiaG
MSPHPDTIRDVRDGCLLTQQQMADCLGVCRRTVQEWEAGRRTMSAGLWELFLLVQVADGRMASSCMGTDVRPSLRRLVA